MRRSINVVAKKLASAHRRADKKTKIIKLFPSAQQDVIQLLEVSQAAPTTGEVLPFRFAADAANGVDYPSVVILLSPEEWQQVEHGDLNLPVGWNLAEAESL
jgi:hypothetical protein